LFFNVQVETTSNKDKGSISAPLHELIQVKFITIAQTSGRTEHHEKLHMLISAEIREHKLAGQTLLLA
jgi:hypothetical protein